LQGHAIELLGSVHDDNREDLSTTDWPMLVAALEDEVGSLAEAVGTAQAAFR